MDCENGTIEIYAMDDGYLVMEWDRHQDAGVTVAGTNTIAEAEIAARARSRESGKPVISHVGTSR